MMLIIILAVIIVVTITIIVIKQETPEQKQHDEKYKLKSHKLKNTYDELKQAVKGNKGTKKNEDSNNKDSNIDLV